MWRTAEEGLPIDTSAAMPNGMKFDGFTGLRKMFLSQPEQFVTTVAEKLLAFGLGRSLEYYDRPTVRKIVRDSAPAGYKWSSIILGVVNSTPFRMKAPEAGPATDAAARAAIGH
jgi:Protein of unknown function (DUF1585)